MTTNNKLNPSLVIMQTSHTDGKLYVKETKGFFQRIRKLLSAFLIGLFILLPFIQFNGGQAILLDVTTQTIQIFAITLYPQDMMIFVFTFIFAAYLLFYVSVKYGRIWCGFACPQTIWAFMFMWVENRIEGNVQQRKKIDKSMTSIKSLSLRASKHIVWIMISFFSATVFMSYFVPVMELYPKIVNLEVGTAVIGWITLFTLCTYVNAGLIREKMCQHMCPYSRFQSAMVSSQTMLVSYDEKRGESRGPRKFNTTHKSGLGDCVDCHICVHVCPVGIDIREGYQADCINCGLCIDACDETMNKFGYEPGLIKFMSSVIQTSSSIKKYGYLVLMIATLLFASIWVNNRDMFELTVIKDRQVLYRVNNYDQIENSYQLEIINKSIDKKYISIVISEENGFEMTPSEPFWVQPNERFSKILTVTNMGENHNKFIPFKFSLLDENGKKLIERSATFQQYTIKFHVR